MRADIINCEQIIPRKLYKYYSVNDNLFNLIRNHSCWFSKPSDFNDPFDCNLDISIGRNPKEIMHNMDKSSMLRLLYDALSQKGDDVIDAGARIIKKPFLLKNIINEIHKYYIDQNIGVFCLSQDPANILMWSHYADNHKGICVEYSFSEKFLFQQCDEELVCFNRICFEDAICDLTKDEDANGYRMLFTKSVDWKYENECRLLSYNPEIEGDFYSIPLDKDSTIKAVYFGLRCQEQTIETVKNILREEKDITFYKMKKNPKNIYKLECYKI